MDAKLMQQADELAREVALQATTLDELNGVMQSLMKTSLEKMLNAELERLWGAVHTRPYGPPMYVESCPRQAARIADVSGVMTVCLVAQAVLGG